MAPVAGLQPNTTMVDDGYGTPRDCLDMGEAYKQENPLEVIIMRGPSGSGKSTWVKENHPYATVCSADNFFMEDDEYVFDVSKLSEAHQECFGKFLRAIANGDRDIIVDNTHLRWWEYRNYIMAANMLGAEVHIVQFVPRMIQDLKLCFDRAKHGTPSTLVAMQGWNFELPKPVHPLNQKLLVYSVTSLTVLDAHAPGYYPTPKRDAVEAWFKGKSHWEEHPDHAVESWRYEIANGDTRQSYKEWAMSEAEQEDLVNSPVSVEYRQPADRPAKELGEDVT